MVILIDNAYAVDPTAIHLGPYNVADANTQVIRTRRTYYIPPAYIPLFIDRAMSPHEAWIIVYSQLLVDGRLNNCSPLVDYLYVCLTRLASNNNSVTAIPKSTASLADELLLNRFYQIC